MKSPRQHQRGMTLVLALFVTFLLATLSLAFVTLMMEDSRGSRASSWQVMASESAEWGVHTALSYMGRGGNWQPAFDAERLAFFDLLNSAQPNGFSHLIASAGGSGEVQVQVAAGTGEESSVRRLRLVDPGLPMGSVMSLGDDILARVEVEVKPVQVQLSSFGPGQAAQYQLVSRAELYRKADLTAENPIPVAVSVLEAQVRPEVETTALFQVQNMRSWDIQGSALGNPNMADKILIPEDFASAGSVRVTGADPTDTAAPWKDQAGNVRFQNPNSDKMVFRGQLSVSQLNNIDGGGNPVTTADPENFPGGVVFGSDYTPLPDAKRYLNSDKNGDGRIGDGGAPNPAEMASTSQEWGLLAAASVETGGESSHGEGVRGYYRVDKALVEEAHSQFPRTADPSSSIPLSNQDYRPPVPEVQVTLKNGGMIEVNVWSASAGDAGTTSNAGNLNAAAATTMGSQHGPLGQTFHVSQLKNGVLYVEGGQVVVKSEMTSGNAAEFEGRLQIVAAEDGTRRGQASGSETVYPNAQSSIYHKAATEFFDWQKSRLTLSPSDPDYADASSFKAPPYTAEQLLQGSASGHVSTDVSALSAVGPTDLYWPPPLSSVEREGNLVIASDILKKEGSNSVLGLTAENYLLLGDRTLGQKAAQNELRVDGVLTSFNHSLQLDWDNTGNNRSTTGSGTGSYVTISTPGFNGKISLKGSMLAPYSNVEGDLQGRGYPRQEFLHDDDLLRWAPPFQPRTLLSEYSNSQITISWNIISFTDRSSLGVKVE